ncbi:hypothetical protein F5I97DRAFT_1106621 [Phlebopus sp. FC_14]|nr:hypothetical protein F5I97DRAFT_1106621 [Phlebopus sp. FC_14]
MSGSVPFSCLPPSKDDEIKKILAIETSGRYVGPMPVEEFLQRFLPSSKTPCPTLSQDVFDDVSGASSETAMYPQFIQSVSPLAPDMELVDTHNHACDVGEFTLKPDVSLYAKGTWSQDTITDFTTIEMWVEFKATASDDPFVDYASDDLPQCNSKRETFLIQSSFENGTAIAQQIRGQLTAYALAQFGLQFRNFAFSVLVMGSYARLMRWERAGAVVTRKFDYTKNPDILTEFFWRFSHMSPDQRGLDLTVSVADGLSTMDADLIVEHLRLKAGTPLFRYQVPDGERTRSYFGPRPPCPSVSLIGRSTRALPVYDLEKQRLVYLKDTWRINADDIRPEGEVYKELHDANVPNIPPLECSGDLGYQTVTETLVSADWSCVRMPLTGHVHYRIVLGVVGRKLTTFKSTKELVQALLDALSAHWAAYEVAKILHRDISSGNIIITEDGRGLLIDWDLSKSLEELKRRRRDRTGTWQFMSAALLQDAEKRHELQDDLESFVHVLAWTTVRYVRNRMSPDQRRVYLKMYDENDSVHGKTVGGSIKAFRFKTQEYVSDITLAHPSPLLDLLGTLSDVFTSRYAKPPTDSQRQRYERLKQTDDAAAKDLPAHNYYEGLEHLATSQWFIATFQESLASPGWLDNDGAVKNTISSGDPSMTRQQEKTHTSHMDSRESRQLASYHPARASHAHSSKRTRSPSSSAVERSSRSKRARRDAPTINHD